MKTVPATSQITIESVAVGRGWRPVSMAYHPNGREIAVGDDDGIIWNIMVGSDQLHEKCRGDGMVHNLAYSHDGKWLAATYVGRPGTSTEHSTHVRLWYLEDVSQSVDIPNTPKRSEPYDFFRSEFTNDSRGFLWSHATWEKDEKQSQLLLYDMTTRATATAVTEGIRCPLVVEEVTKNTFGVLACGTFWSAQIGSTPSLVPMRSIHTMADAVDWNNSIAFVAIGGQDHSGGQLFTRDASIELRHIPDGRFMESWQVRRYGQTVSWNALRLSPDGKWLAAANGLGVYLIDVPRRKQVAHLTPQVNIIDLGFSPDGNMLAAVGGQHLLLWQMPHH